MNYVINKINSTSIELVIKLNPIDHETAVINELRTNAVVDGFRKGYVPIDILRAKFSDVIAKRVLDNIMSKEYLEIIKKENIDVLNYPSLKNIVGNNNELEIFLNVSIFPEVKLAKYVGHKLKKPKLVAEKSEINSILENLAEKHSVTVDSKNKKAKLGDLVIIDFEGSIDGKIFAGGSHKDYQLKLGSKSFIDTFEEQIVGHKIGDEFDVDVKFPADYHQESFKNKPAKFKVRLNGLKNIELAKIDDSLAKTEGFADLVELEKFVTDKILFKKERDAEEGMFNDLVEKIASKSTLDVPESLVKKEMSDKLEKYRKSTEKEASKEEAAEIEKNVIAELREMLVIREILKRENITVTEDEIKNYVENNFSMKYEDVVKSDSERFLTEIESNLRLEKLKRFLIDANI